MGKKRRGYLYSEASVAILNVLARLEEPLYDAKIAQLAGLSRPVASENLRSLERRGLISHVEDPGHLHKFYSATADGIAMDIALNHFEEYLKIHRALTKACGSKSPNKILEYVNRLFA